MPVISNEEAYDALVSTSNTCPRNDNIPLSEGQFAMFAQSTGAANGDSGGPAVITLPTGEKYLIGIASFTGCPRPEFPSVYVNVAQYTEYINEILETKDIISEDQTWPEFAFTNRAIPNELIIEEGVTLTIESGFTVLFNEGAKLIIKPGARLVLEGKLTASCESGNWLGVEVWGNNEASQYTVGGVQAQGRLDARPGSEIENALTAVKLYGPTEDDTGGIIYCYATTFSNNAKGIEFKSFQNFWPYPTSQQGQPRRYLASFSDCTFETDDSYNLPLPFNAFVEMTDVNGARFMGCDFTNTQNVSSASSLADYGWGIKAQDSGFRLEGRCNNTTITEPCNSIETGTFSGLGYGVEVTNSSEIQRPYTVLQQEFSACYFGLYNSGVSNATILHNTFFLGQLPGGAIVSDGNQVGIMLEMAVAGFEMQENNFNGVVGNANTTIGTCVRDLFDFGHEIRRNTYSGLDYGNMAEGDNAADPLSQEDRGLTYLCNTNSTVISTDFIVNDELTVNRIRPSQGLQFINDQGQPNHRASGNTFSYTGIDFDNKGDGIDYYFFEQGFQEMPRELNQFSFGVISISQDENTCPIIYCEPPCKTTTEVEEGKEKFHQDQTKKSSADTEQQAALANGNSTLAELKGVEASYYRQQMDKNAYMVVLHTVYDTIQFDEDTLAIWVENLDLFGADIIWALRQQSEGNYSEAFATLDRASKRSDLSQQDQQDLRDMPMLMNALRGKGAHKVAAHHFKELEVLTSNPQSFTGNIAKNILRQHGYYFPPVFHLPNNKGSVVSEKNFDAISSVLSLAQLNLYPNPNDGRFIVHWKPDTATDIEATLTIRDLSGRIILEQSIVAQTQQSFNLPLQQSGVYYYQLATPSAPPLTGKLIIH